MGSYVTNDEIVEFMQGINPDFNENDIDATIVGGMYDFINKKIGTEYGVEDRTYLVDGNGDYLVWSLYLPIVYLNSVTIIKENEERVDLDLHGEDRNCWYDADTGFIKSSLKFPLRPDSVELRGKFGEIPSDLVKLLQLLLIYKTYTITQPSKYHGDLVEEKIGRYSYKLSDTGTYSEDNQRKGLDGYIAYLFDALGRMNNMAFEAI